MPVTRYGRLQKVGIWGPLKELGGSCKVGLELRSIIWPYVGVDWDDLWWCSFFPWLWDRGMVIFHLSGSYCTVKVHTPCHQHPTYLQNQVLRFQHPVCFWSIGPKSH